jgi:hypothetical protein
VDKLIFPGKCSPTLIGSRSRVSRKGLSPGLL